MALSTVICRAKKACLTEVCHLKNGIPSQYTLMDTAHYCPYGPHHAMAAAPERLSQLNLQGATVTMDAMDWGPADCVALKAHYGRVYHGEVSSP